MSEYREFQLSRIMVAAMLITLMVVTLLFTFQLGAKPIGIISYLIVLVSISLGTLMGYGMTTTIEDDRLTLSFGLGLIKKSFDLRGVKSVAEVKNPWYYGWGIRIIPGGWLYNVSGDQAVELKFLNGKLVRIGSEQVGALADAIGRRLEPKTDR